MQESKLHLVAGFLILAINGCGDGGGLTTDVTLVDANPVDSTPLLSVDAAGIDTPPGQIDGPGRGDVDGGVLVDAATESCNYPRCYTALVEGCVPQGPCVTSRSGVVGGIAIALCYENGVKGLVTTIVAPSGAMSRTDIWKNPSGVCYSTALPPVRRETLVPYTMRDGTDAVVVTVMIDYAKNTKTFTCDDETSVVVSGACPGGPASDLGISQCTEGDCTF